MLSILRSLVLSSPVIAMFITAILVMFMDLFCNKSKMYKFIIFLGLVASAFLCLNLYQTYRIEMWSNMFVSDNVTYIMQLFIVISVGLSVFYSISRFPTLDSDKGDVLSLYFLSAVGMMSLVAAQTLLSIYISLELTSLPLYALVASQKNEVKAIEAAVKYFVMGALASVFILFGMSLLYGATGNLSLDQISNTLSLLNNEFRLLVLFALILIVAGASFKLALVPFHMWIPDVYAGANPVMTLFLSAAPKIAGLGIFLRISMSGLFDAVPLTHYLLASLALISIIFGNLNALVQKDLRRLLAYSTIAHMGYAILGFVSGGPEGQSSSMLYILVYSFMTIAGFALVILPAKNEIRLNTVEDLSGLAKRSPWLAFMLLIVFFSMAGIPPAVGFLAKFFVIRSLLDAGWTNIAIFALLFAVIGAFYYLKLIKTMYFDSPTSNTPLFDITKFKRLVFFGNCLILLILGIFPNTLITACVQAF